MIRFSLTASSQDSCDPDDAVNVCTTAGENTMPSTLITATTSASVQNSRFANPHTSSGLFSLMYVVNTGMNEAVIEPSATSRRNRFGMRYANTKESAASDVPSNSVYLWSRT